jgi:ESS family glutamate:Na+ symporter
MANRLMRGQRTLEPAGAALPETAEAGGGFVQDLAALTARLTPTVIHLTALFLCLKLGAFFSAFVRETGTEMIRQIPGVDPTFTLVFPVYMGSMILAVVLRNLHDAMGLKLLDSKHVDLIASLALAWLLSAIMIGLRLSDLLALAGPMLVILTVQVVVMVAFSYWVVFRVMGRDYEAAAMSAGMVGFGLGATPNAVATMKAMARQYGPAPRAFLIVTVVGAFLIDFVNSFFILSLLNLFK